jgi:hypothetical protein
LSDDDEDEEEDEEGQVQEAADGEAGERPKKKRKVGGLMSAFACHRATCLVLFAGHIGFGKRVSAQVRKMQDLIC